MKIKDLTERLLKVPSSARNQIMRLVASNILSRMHRYSVQIKDEFTAKRMVAMANAYSQKYNGEVKISTLARTSTKVTFDSSELPQSYQRTRLASKELFVSLAYSKELNFYPEGSFDNSMPPELVIAVPSNQTLEGVNHKYVDLIIQQIQGYVEHELMHAVQFFALGTLQPGQNMGYYDHKGDVDPDKYYIHALEQDPLIAVNVENFKAFLRELTLAGLRLTPEQKKTLMLKWVNPNANADNLPQGVTAHTGEVFDHLYAKNKKLWKHAAKKFIGLVRNEDH